MVGVKDTAGRPGPGEAQSHRRPGMLGGGQGGRSGHAVPWTVPQRVTRPRGKAWTEVTFRLENNLRASHGDPELERLRGSGQGERGLRGVAPGGRAPWKLHPPPPAPAGLPQPLCQAGWAGCMGRGSPQPGRAGEPGPEPGEQGRLATFPGRLTVVIIPSTKRPLSSQTQTREKSPQGLGCRRRIRLGESTDCERPGSRVSSQTVSVAAARLCLRERDRAAGRVEVNERDRVSVKLRTHVAGRIDRRGPTCQGRGPL